ncbi:MULTISPECIES: DUF3558 domain-containing protein [Streptomyces]|uniref:DUF3558 domain-containing protein n=1 Tax=Streptomyces solicathayae TaxID=3081768 RepID=A0ABZ0LTM7_9ACTN|nr:DUF3558 domain-containing protein [Streptomyces sp. HUAS YS2]WOX22853.1 DUF3558 domain-containing protein [Streptomyces sp. HUAS YS2]
MQRKAYDPGHAARPARHRAALTTAALAAAVVALGAGLTGCSAGTSADGLAADAKAGTAGPRTVPPGRYSTLFEPCGSVEQATLKDLLPGAAELPDEQREKVYAGAPAVTYDNGRRVGCTWNADGPDTSHELTLDLERVVSYDPAVSDDDRAQQVYSGKQIAAHLPSPPVSPPPATGTTGTGTASKAPGSTPATPPASPTAPASPPVSPSAPGGSAPAGSVAPPGATAGATGLEPRVLEGLGHAAFLNDVLTEAGSASRQRTVSVVFRTSNVIVTVEYTEQVTATAELPDSKELQEKAQSLARQLADRLED